MSDYSANCRQCQAEYRANMYGMGRCPACDWQNNPLFPEQEAKSNLGWEPPKAPVNVARPIRQVYMTFTTDLDKPKPTGYTGRWDQKPE